MTIEEQEIYNILNRVFERPKPFFISRDVDDILTIKDNYAIEFAEWYLSLWLRDDDLSFDNYSPKELLEIFKKEKGL
jgi:hypothetical protein